MVHYLLLLLLIIFTIWISIWIYLRIGKHLNKNIEYIYLDNNGTTRPFDESLELMVYIMKNFYGNAGGNYQLGAKSKRLLELSREKLASLVNCETCEVFFTSGATESNNIAIRGVFAKHKEKGKHIITTATEHPSVYEVCKSLHGADLTILPVDKYGKIDLQELNNAIRKDTIIVAVIAGNNEIGTINDTKSIANICREKQVHCHADLTQIFGKYQVNLHDLGVDSATGSGHKFHAPKATGFLYLKKGSYFSPDSCLAGGHQEKNIRSGTENVAGIFSMCYSLYMCNVLLQQGHAAKIEKMREYMKHEIMQNVPGTIVNGHPTDMMYNTLSLCLPINSRKLLMMLDKNNIAVNTGSACSKGKSSRILDAIGLTPQQQEGSLRISFGFLNTWDDCKFAAKHIVQYANLLLYKNS